MTYRIRAICTGPAVPRKAFEGTVHSVFRNAANLRVSGESVLLTLVSSEQADLPQGIRLEVSDGFTVEALSVGARAACADGVLTVGDVLTVDLRGASAAKCDLSCVSADMTDHAAVAAWQHAWRALGERRARTGPAASAHEAAAGEQIKRALASVVAATTAYDLGGMDAVGALIGLGTGLTPTGDDILAGYLAGLWCTAGSMRDRQAFLSGAAELVTKYASRTNDIAQTYLCLAARGQVSSRMVELAQSIGRGEDEHRITTRTRAAMEMGHNSGTETVKGLLHGLAAWDAPELLRGLD